MFPKNSGNAWNGRARLLKDDQKSASEKWPQLGKPGGHRSENNIESWPKLGKSNNIKSEDRNSDKKNYSQSESRKPEIKSQWTKTTCDTSGNKKESLKQPISTNDAESLHGNPKTSIDPRFTAEENHQRTSEESEPKARSNKEEKKLIFKKMAKDRKQALQVEKQRKKEYEAIRKLVGPKGISVTVIDDSIFSKFQDQNVKPSLQDTANPTGVQLDSTAFPDLGSRSKRRVVKCTNDIKLESLRKTSPNPVSSEEKNDVEKVVGVDDTPKAPKPRRRDPVMLDIIKAIEICNLKRRAAEENASEISALKKREKKVFQAGGNILDSSNPLRHRGKKREKPKKRDVTILKKAIMAERERRRQKYFKTIETKEKNDPDLCTNKVMNGNVIACSESVISNVADGSLKVNMDEKSVLSDEVAESSLSNKSEKYSEECLMKPAAETSNEFDINMMVKESLHSRKFREYCNHSTNADISGGAKQMLTDIIRFQDKMYANNPTRAESHRRYVVGLRQTQNLLTVRKIKVVILATDLEKVPSPGGLDEVVNNIIGTANGQGVPVVFPFIRRELGKVTYRKVGVSCVGVLNYQGSESNFQMMMSALEVAKRDYEEKFEKEKLRIMGELGLPNVKKEEEGNVTPTEEITVPNVNLPLLQKLTEMISELSVCSSSPNENEEEIFDS